MIDKFAHSGETLKRDQYSHVWREGYWVYKQQHEFLHDNEVYFYKLMEPSGFVLPCEEISRDTIRLPFISQYRHYARAYLDTLPSFAERILTALKRAGIRHGDLTEYAVLLDDVDGKIRPRIIDFSESRFWDDPRKDKRPEGDEHWIRKTLKHIKETRMVRYGTV